MNITKYCKDCRRFKTLNLFYPKSARCSECVNGEKRAKTAGIKWFLKTHKERAKEYRKRPEVKERRKS